MPERDEAAKWSGAAASRLASSSSASAGRQAAIQGGMRKSRLVIAALLLSAWSALAEPPGLQKSEKAAVSGKTLPLRGASSADSCAAYGPGFVKVEGSGTQGNRVKRFVTKG